MLSQQQIQEMKLKLGSPPKPQAASTKQSWDDIKFSSDVAKKQTNSAYDSTKKKGLIEKFGDLSGKLLGGATKMSGLQALTEAAAPAAQMMSRGMSYLGPGGEEIRKQQDLGPAQGEVMKATEKGGVKAGLTNLAGQSSEAFSKLAAFTGVPTTAIGRIGLGTAIGATSGISEPLKQDKPMTKILTSGVEGAITGALVSGVFEGLAQGVSRFGKSKLFSQGVGDTYNKELSVDSKEIQNAIKGHFQTLGEKFSNVVDDTGKAVYKGDYATLFKKAEGELNTLKPQVTNLIKQAPGTVTTKSEVIGSLIKDLQDQYGALTPLQLKTITNISNKMPKKMNTQQLDEIKHLFDNFLKDADWSKIARGNDAQLSFAQQIYYTLRDNARKLVNEKSGNPVIQELNNRMHLAMEMRDLTSLQMAQRRIAKVFKSGGGGVFGKMISKAMDDVIFNPAITTRLAQGRKALGNIMSGSTSRVGQTPVRQFIRSKIIEQSSK